MGNQKSQFHTTRAFFNFSPNFCKKFNIFVPTLVREVNEKRGEQLLLKMEDLMRKNRREIQVLKYDKKMLETH